MLDSRGLIDGKHYILTFTGASGDWYVNNIELGILHQYVDYGNIMTYDIHVTWDKYTNFNAPLYNNSDSSLQLKWSVDSSINSWLRTGFPKDFHSESMVPWLFNGSTFISYEDEQSIGLKAQYIKDKGLGGAMIWELSQDSNKVLLNSLYNSLK